MNFLLNGTGACACIYTSGSDSPRQYKHTPQPTEQTKRANKINELPKIKRQNTKASEVGFRAEPLAKTPTFSLLPNGIVVKF